MGSDGGDDGDSSSVTSSSGDPPSHTNPSNQPSNQPFNITTDPICTAVLNTPGRHFVGVVADGGPRISTIMVDGVLCDGGGHTPYGWKWFDAMGSVRGSNNMAVGMSNAAQSHQSQRYGAMIVHGGV